MEFVKETPAEMADREEAEGIKLPPLPFADHVITAAILNDDGSVAEILIDARGNVDGAIPIDMADGPTVGAPLPWPRTKRDQLLAASDWTEFRFDKAQEWRDAWASYRQALRDLPDAQPNPAAIVWPQEPDA